MFYRKLTYPAVIFSVIKSMVLKKQNLHYRVKYTIPPMENNTEPWYCDYWLYKERHPAECIFNKIKAFTELLLVMISLIHRFLLSYTLLPFGFCLNDTTLLSFQIRSSVVSILFFQVSTLRGLYQYIMMILSFFRNS